MVAESGRCNRLVLAMTTHTSSGLLVTEGVECLERDVRAHLYFVEFDGPLARTVIIQVLGEAK